MFTPSSFTSWVPSDIRKALNEMFPVPTSVTNCPMFVLIVVASL